jgi:hypothetical protein
VQKATGLSPLALMLGVVLSSVGLSCGRSVRGTEAGVSGSAGALNGTGGAEARAGNSGMAGAAVVLAPEAPMEVRHVTLGAPVTAGCLSSVVPTTTGIRYAGNENPAAFAGVGNLDEEGRWHFTQQETPDDIAGPALVFGDATGQVVAWPSRCDARARKKRARRGRWHANDERRRRHRSAGHVLSRRRAALCTPDGGRSRGAHAGERG